MTRVVHGKDCEADWGPEGQESPCRCGLQDDWTSVSGIPTTDYLRGPLDRGDGKPDPRYVQSNIYTLSQIGDDYDMLAVAVEEQHLNVLVPWRIDSGAPSAVDYIEYKRSRRNQGDRN